MQEQITYCSAEGCTNTSCKKHQSNHKAWGQWPVFQDFSGTQACHNQDEYPVTI